MTTSSSSSSSGAGAGAGAINASLSVTETGYLLALSLGSLAVIGNTFHGDGEPLVASLALSGLAFAASYAMIRWLGPTFMAAGLKGRDLGKTHRREIPETMGAVCAVVYLLLIIVFIPFPFYKDIVAATSGGGNRDVVVPAPLLTDERGSVETGRFLHKFPHSKLASYLSAILSLQSVVILGIGDDLFDIRWRHKFFIPAFASIPILIVYFVDFGVTSVVVPTALQPFLGDAAGLLDLSYLYYVYMAAVAIFCPNSINILAGINGIEVAQSLVVALLLALNDALYIVPFASLSSSSSSPPHPAVDSHLFSLYMLLPFIGVSGALLAHNWFPARVFVGDTYCYFAGMIFAVVAILGHFSKTLLLLLGPQIANFLYSAPQLLRLVPCPRHRLPRLNARTGLLEPSVAEWGAAASSAAAAPSAVRAPPALVLAGLRLLHRLRLVRLQFDAPPRDGAPHVTGCTNLTILNLWLVWWGPMREDRLALGVLALQAACGLAGLFVRHRLALWVFKEDNWAL